MARVTPSLSRKPSTRITPSGAVPLHAQIERALRRMIRRPAYRDGALFPDELTLADKFGVSRGTVRVALGRLVDQRLLERKRGFGTRVLPAPVESSITEWRSFSQEMARSRVAVKSFFQEVRRVAAPVHVARALRIGKGTGVLRLDRVRGWEGRPVLHSRSWFHPRLRLAKSTDFNRPLYELIQDETGAVAESAREQFSAVGAPAALAQRLHVETGAPLLVRCHAVYDQGRRPIEFAEVHYVSARFVLTLDLKRNGG